MKLTVDHINKYFKDFHVLKDVSFEVQSGRAHGFLGRNGAGKTTTFRCLMDVFKPNSGQFLVDGEVLDPHAISIGYLPEERGLYLKNEILGQLIFLAELRGGLYEECRKSALSWLDRFGLKDYAHRKMEVLSKGNQQKVQIIQAFVNEPDILILDEPFSGLDPVNAQVFKDVIKEFVAMGKLVVFSSHQMAYVEEMCDDISLIHKGEILLTGQLDEIKSSLGKDKVVVEVAGIDSHDLLSQLSGVSGQVLEGQALIDLGPSTFDRRSFYGYLFDQGYDVTFFSAYQPSLQSIFLERAHD